MQFEPDGAGRTVGFALDHDGCEWIMGGGSLQVVVGQQRSFAESAVTDIRLMAPGLPGASRAAILVDLATGLVEIAGLEKRDLARERDVARKMTRHSALGGRTIAALQS